MPLYKNKENDKIVEAWTFDEFVQYGRDSGASLVRNMPWSFDFKGYRASHENDSLYLISDPHSTVKFQRGEMLLKHEIEGFGLWTTEECFLGFHEPVQVEVAECTMVEPQTKQGIPDLIGQVVAFKGDIAHLLDPGVQEVARPWTVVDQDEEFLSIVRLAGDTHVRLNDIHFRAVQVLN